MHQKYKPVVLAALLYGVLPILLQINPLVQTIASFLIPIFFVGYYILSKKLLTLGSLNYVVAVAFAVIACIVSYTVGTLLFMLGSVFFGQQVVKQLHTLSGFLTVTAGPLSALLGVTFAKLLFDVQMKSTLMSRQNIVAVLCIASGSVIFLWNIKFLETMPERQEAKREQALQQLLSAPSIGLYDISFSPRTSHEPQRDWELFTHENTGFSLRIPPHLKARIGTNGGTDEVFLQYKKPTNRNSEQLFATITTRLQWNAENNFKTRDEAVLFTIKYVEPYVKTLNWPVAIDPLGESSKTISSNELYFIVTEYANPSQAKIEPAKTLYTIQGTPASGYAVWKIYLADGADENLEIAKKIMESLQ